MEATTYGTSIIVPSVQELAKESKMVTVPDRYIRSIEDASISLTEQNPVCDYNDLQVPIIDLEGLMSGDDFELKKFYSACQEWGFFQLINHGVSSTLVEKFKKETQDLFNLPIEEKKKYWQKPNEIEGFGQAFVVHEEQKLDWADMFFLTTFPKHHRKPHLFPLLPPVYRDTLENYSAEIRKLGLKIIERMEKTLEIDSLNSAFGDGLQSMRMNYYPPCPQPEKVIGLTEHSDGTALTILLQLNDIEGLQVLKDGKWVSVKPVHNAFVVNIGDILEILSNGIFRSVNHRAVVNAEKERLSVATFYFPSFTKEIGPIPELITGATPAKFKRITMVDFFKRLFSRKLDGKYYLESLRISECA